MQSESEQRVDQRPLALLISTIAVVDPNDTSLWTPLSILAVGTALQEAGFRPVMIDTQVDHDWRSQVEAVIHDVTFLGVSTLTGPSILGAIEVIEHARSLRPEIPIIWGGYHASLSRAMILDEGWADYVVRGVGEPAIGALARAIAADDCDESVLSAIPNLSFRAADRIVDCPLRSAKSSEIPPLDYSLIDPTRYYTPGRRAMTYISSYACPWRCSYCAEPAHTLRVWRGLEPERVVRELRELAVRYEPEYVDLVDPNFSSSPPRAIAIAELLRQRPLGDSVRLGCNMRAGDVVRIAKKIDLGSLREAGFARIFLGLESGSDRMLKGVLQKDSSVADAREATRLLSEAGIEQLTSFIHDIPEETEADSDLTLGLAEELAPLALNKQFHHFFMPFPSTEIYENLVSAAAIDDTGISLREWANANTFGGWARLWPGRIEFRRRVIARLSQLSQTYPATFSYPQTIPDL